MMTDSPATTALPQKFQAFYELFAEFSQDLAEIHGAIPMHDDADRAVYNSLSRLLAFSDQLNLLVSLMREDVRVVEELTAPPVTASWIGQEFERCFADWVRAARLTPPIVN